MPALAAAPWHDALAVLLSAAPLSPDDCLLYLDMLPLLQMLLGSGHDRHQQLRRVAERFAGSALAWLQEAASGGAPMGHPHAALLPAVLHTVRFMAEQAQWCSSGDERAQVLRTMQAPAWLNVLCRALQQGTSYAGRVAALQLAAALVDALGDFAACSAGPLVECVLRRVLMPRELWSTAHRHGKAAVLAALALLLAITQATPAAGWAEAWAHVGSTFWLSRAASDDSPAVRQATLHLLAAAAAVPCTRALLDEAWPKWVDTAISAAAAAAETAGIRAAALAAVVAALAPGLPSTEHLADPEADCGAEEGAGGSPADVPQLSLPPSAAQQLLQSEDLWASVAAILQLVRLADWFLNCLCMAWMT